MYPLKPLLTACFGLITFTAFAQVAPPDTLKINSTAYAAVEVEASYPGEGPAWMRFLEKNLNADVPVKNDAPVGIYTAIAAFAVDKDGTLSNVKAVTRFGFGMEDEIMRVIERSGKWVPALQNGTPVKAYRRQPITFIVNSDAFKISTAQPYTLFANRDNELTVTAKKIKPEDIAILVAGGKATPMGEGKFSVRVNKTGRTTITVVNSKKEDKEIGVASFEVIAN